jgi:hypothetical protein
MARKHGPHRFGQQGGMKISVCMYAKSNQADDLQTPNRLACAESFFHSLKVEVIHGERFVTREEMRRTVFEYIEVDYNRTRRHSANGYISPALFEAK